eukprot:2862979-Pleurochrysis_carterae.AAC.3
MLYAQTFDSPRELLIPRYLQDLKAWLDTLLDDLVIMRDAPDTRMRPQPFVRGQLWFVPEARGCVWDLRGPVVMPLNFTAEPASPLNVSYIAFALPHWPDAPMLSYLVHGVRFEVNMPLQSLVRFPHLISFPNGFTSLQKAVRRMQSRGWFGIFSHLPYLPIRMICQGATTRKYEPVRWRSTTDAGAPR